MLVKEITFTNFNGETKKQPFLFHLTQAELVRLDVEFKGGLEEHIKKMVENKDGKVIMAFFERVILMAYGEKSEDGDVFVKNDELRSRFANSAAYDVLFTELVTNADAATSFVNGIVPTTPKKK